MKVEKLDGNRERRILTAMITNNSVLARIRARWSDSLFASKWTNLVAKWCVDFHEKYHTAPGKEIESLFATWCESNKDETTQNLVSRFLVGLSEEYEKQDEINVEHLIDTAGKYFNKVKISKHLEIVEGYLLTGEIEKAESQITKYTRIEMGLGSGLDLVTDESALNPVFLDESKDQLFSYPGALGEFFKGTLERDSFLCFLASQKTGKTFALIDLAYRALISRKKIAFFEIGDLSEQQISERFFVRIAKHPIRGKSWPLSVKYPISINIPGPDKLTEIQHEIRKYDFPLNADMTKKACKNLMENIIKSKECYFKLFCHANFSISVLGIEQILDTWEVANWRPDVVVIDYADNLAPIVASKDSRESVNETWKHLRRISQERHLLLATATQANALSYTSEYLSRKHFSEDNRKLSHVTAMCGINSSDAEKEQGLVRLNWIVLREKEFSSRRFVHCAGCLSLANLFIKSSYFGYKEKK